GLGGALSKFFSVRLNAGAFVGSILAMDPQAVEQAKIRLKKAETAIARLKSADSFEQAEDAWTDFLSATSTIYSKLEQGAKVNGKSSAWFGRKKKERKDDPLLRYLHYARNSDEHGVQRLVERRTKGDRPLFGGAPLKFGEKREYIARIVGEDGTDKTGD